MTKRVAGGMTATLTTYRWWLTRFTAAVSSPTPLTVRQFFVSMQSKSASHQHQAYRKLRTFFRWCSEVGYLQDYPMRGFTMRTPKTLPGVPTEDELHAVLAVCPDTLKGTRNRALILVLGR